jgi:hypothetical protein
VVWALAAAGDVLVEQLRRRSGTARAVAAGLFFLDVGAAEHAWREAVLALRRRVRIRPPPLRSCKLATVWTTVVILLRSPWLWGRALIALGAAAVAATAAAATAGSATAAAPLTGRLLAWLAVTMVAGYAAASALVEPVRAERAQGFGARFLGWSERELLLRHLLAPTIALAVLAAAVGAAAALISGAGASAGIAAAAGAAAAPGLMLAAAYGALRPRPDDRLLLLGEMGAQLWAAQASAGLQAAAALALTPALIASLVAKTAGTAAALLVGGGWALVSAMLARALLRRWLGRQR